MKKKENICKGIPSSQMDNITNAFPKIQVQLFKDPLQIREIKTK